MSSKMSSKMSIVNLSNNSKKIEILDDRSALISRALELVLESYHQALASKNEFTFVLSGGSTPKPLYEKLATQNLDWEKVHVFWGDERYVPINHPDSNEAMTRTAWLNHVKIPAQNIHAMPTNESDPEVAAQKYETHLREFFQIRELESPKFDLILLGLGDDGHTASLFPNSKALNIADRLIVVGEKNNQPRLTFTASLINQGQKIIFLVQGAGKENAINAVMAQSEDANLYPARFVTSPSTWLIVG